MEVQLDMVYKLVLGMSEEQTARYLHSEWDEGANTHSLSPPRRATARGGRPSTPNMTA
jgi:hypothetical protein